MWHTAYFYYLNILKISVTFIQYFLTLQTSQGTLIIPNRPSLLAETNILNSIFLSVQLSHPYEMNYEPLDIELFPDQPY